MKRKLLDERDIIEYLDTLRKILTERGVEDLSILDMVQEGIENLRLYYDPQEDT